MSFLSGLYNLLVLGGPKDQPGGFDPSAVKKILVVRNDNIGDVICTTPALDALRKAFPNAHIAALVCTLAEEAIKGHRALDELYVYPKAKHKKYGKIESLLRLARVQSLIRKQKYDLAISFRSSFSSSQAWLNYASKARWRVGPEARGKRKKWGFYYNIPVDWPPEGMHEVKRCFYMLKALGLDMEPGELFVAIPPLSGEKVETFLEKQGFDKAVEPVIVNITRWAYRPDRLWPSENYRDLVQQLISRGEKVVVTHAPADGEWVRELLAGIEPVPLVYWSRSLKEFTAMIKRASVFITAEGGPMHLAASVGTPQVILWGRTKTDVWSPWQAPYSIVVNGGNVSDIRLDQVLNALESLAPKVEKHMRNTDEL
ncbi:glycosyltransferase family 9 protein [Dethiosulfatarculus sandiegensis]|uniref:Uncharacterized protein n=1 Tax=Dethiosulfatarculus sandiegensis TaxID=1429043 RepID=A0A0D2GD95_9BACT|nr:glycosyltransferase family 9 protein [Dethiosulfatarculus sandiegensis]KIX12922.1 hypothetical protein X474_16470 [Dethiosulfatarculus sandiegensis]